MGTIEEIVYKAYDLGIRDDLFKRVNELLYKSENKYKELINIYTEAFKELTELKEV